MQLQQQDIASQVQERQAQAEQRQLAVQKQQRLTQILSTAKVDPTTGAPDPASPEMQSLFREYPEVHSALMEHYSKVATEASNRETAASTRANLQSEIDKRTADQKKEADALAKQNAEETAGILIPNSETYQNGEKFALFKVRQADGSYKNERRSISEGKAEGAPRTPVPGTDIPFPPAVQAQKLEEKNQPQPPMSPERFKQELELERQKAATANAIPPLDFIKEQSGSGASYIDASKVEPKTLNTLQTAAGQAGIPVVDKDTASGLRDAATVRLNQQRMMDLLNGKLAETPISRLFVAPANKFKAIGQIDPDLAITGSFIGPAISSLRAMAGARNFRITQAEINAAIDNFVPKATDTIDVAKKKLATIDGFLADKEKIALGNKGTGQTRNVGDVVTVKGRQVRITKVNPDGTFEGVPQ